jgi:hypothetical protein
LLAPLLLLAGCADETVAYWPTGIRRHAGGGRPHHEEGTWRYWYFDGQLRARGRYAGGRRTGTWETWFRNGQRAARGARAHAPDQHASLREGPWTFWHENGVLRAAGTYAGGLRQGDWRYFKADGSPDEKHSGRYVDDERVDG